MSNFDERSVVPSSTPWGSWYQTIEEVVIEVDIPLGTRSRDIKCIKTTYHLTERNRQRGHRGE